MSLLVSLKEIIIDGHKTRHLLFMWLKTGCYLQRTYTGIMQVRLHCLIHILKMSPVYESLIITFGPKSRSSSSSSSVEGQESGRPLFDALKF